ncbi:MAG TPA: PRC-barrel domain-containing protein [Chloroflexota bacterium]|nr:PRC-barrel domain-containing protein [Chloroflexota bacterium]
MFQEEEDQGSARLVTKDRQSGSTRSSSGSSWGMDNKWLAVGAAAAATAGAALFARSRKSSSEEFELKLQTDENIRLISSSKVEGTPVVGRDGERLGKIENFMVDKYSGRVAYAVLSFGGTFGFGESLFPLPWSFLRYDVQKDGYVLNLTKEQLSRAPKFKPSETPEFSAGYRRTIANAYGPYRR